MIRVLMDSNEQNSDRAKELQRVVTSHSDTFIWDGFHELPVDCRFQDMCSGRYISVELKETADLVSSVITGHLAQQTVVMKSAGEPGFVVCIGSMDKVFHDIPPIAGGKYRGKDQILRDFGRIKTYCSTSYAEGYPVMFWDTDWAGMMLHHIQDYFKQSSICEFLHKDKREIVPVAMLCMIPGIGATTARAIIESFKSLKNMYSVSEQDLAEVKVNGKRLGSSKAKKVLEALND
jgi:ERCC4-type nuclease